VTAEDKVPAAPRAPVDLAPIADFLGATLPFDCLAAHDLAQLLERVTISYHTRGESFDAGSDHRGLRILRSGAVDLRDADNTLLDRLGEGESFHIGGLNAERGGVCAMVIEDALIYFLPDAAYQALRQAHRDIDRYFSSQRSRRLRRAARYQPAANTLLQNLRNYMSTDLLTVQDSDTLQAVADIMTRRRMSSALVLRDEQLAGIVTDRDLRARAVAAAIPADTPVREIMTLNPQTVDGGCSLFDATLLMTRCGYHHLPVVEDGKLAGMITTSDLILARQDDPVYLVQHISRQEDANGIKALLDGMPRLVVQWNQAGMLAHQVSRVLTAISDAVTVRLIQLAEAELGPAPAIWCWLGFGSQARAEQLFGADQDNGMILANDARPEDAGWFAQLAQRVCDGLQLCGYPYCRGGIMATTDSWRQPLATWQDTVRGWTNTPSAAAVMRVSIFFDLRAVYGDERLCGQPAADDVAGGLAQFHFPRRPGRQRPGQSPSPGPVSPLCGGAQWRAPGRGRPEETRRPADHRDRPPACAGARHRGGEYRGAATGTRTGEKNDHGGQPQSGRCPALYSTAAPGASVPADPARRHPGQLPQAPRATDPGQEAAARRLHPD
jgi:CBS domain-containing protein